MKSPVKKVLLACLAVLLVFAIGVFMTLNTLVHKGIETIGSDITKTGIKVDSVRIMLLTGHAEMKGLVIDNPVGYSSPYALSCENISIDFDLQSVFSDVFIIKQILIEGPEVMYEGSIKGSNINALKNNIDSYGSNGSTKKASKEEKKQGNAVIARLLIRKGQIRVSAGTALGEEIAVALPEIEMKDIGKEGQGMQISDIVMQVFSTLSRTVVTAVSTGNPLLRDASKTIGDAISQGAKSGSESVGKVLGGIKGILEGNK